MTVQEAIEILKTEYGVYVLAVEEVWQMIRNTQLIEKYHIANIVVRLLIGKIVKFIELE